MVNTNGVYDFRVTVVMEDNSQTRFGARTYGLGDKLANTLIAGYPHAYRVFLSLEASGRVLKGYEKTQAHGIRQATSIPQNVSFR